MGFLHPVASLAIRLAGKGNLVRASNAVESSTPIRSLATARSTRAAPIVSMSRSKWREKKGKPHGSPFLQTKGKLSDMRIVPDHIQRPPYALGHPIPSYPEPEIHDAAGRDRMRRAAAIAAQVLAAAGELSVQAGATTDDIDKFVHAETIRLGAYPSPLAYAGFPKSVCTSVNEVVCHGIPDSTVLRTGDIVKLDVSVFIGGVHGDTCRTFVVGGLQATDAAGQHVVKQTKAALDSAIKLCAPGQRINVIGAHIDGLCTAERLESVSAFSGHGVGSVFHTNPIVHHFTNTEGERYVMKPGMTFTIEPMLTEGSAEVEMWPDGWTVVTRDRGRAAQFEHTLLITDSGVEVLTRYE